MLRILLSEFNALPHCARHGPRFYTRGQSKALGQRGHSHVPDDHGASNWGRKICEPRAPRA